MREIPDAVSVNTQCLDQPLQGIPVGILLIHLSAYTAGSIKSGCLQYLADATTTCSGRDTSLPGSIRNVPQRRILRASISATRLNTAALPR